MFFSKGLCKTNHVQGTRKVCHYLIHVSREFYFVKLVCRIYTLYFHMWEKLIPPIRLSCTAVVTCGSITNQLPSKWFWANQSRSSFAFKWFSRFGGFLGALPNFSSENSGNEGKTITVSLAVTHRVVFVDTSCLVESSSRWVVLVESTSPSHPRRVIASLSRPRRVNRVSASHPRVVMVPHRVILAESSSPRPVLEWKSSRPRRVLKNRLKIRVPIYLFLSVGRKMTPFPETVSDPTITGLCRVVAP